MNDFWGEHWWLVIFLLAMLFPLSAMVMSAWIHRDYARHRREALETLKIYANQGKEPPPEVLDALTGLGWGGRRWRRNWRNAAAASGVSGSTQTDWYEARAAHFAARTARRRSRWAGRRGRSSPPICRGIRFGWPSPRRLGSRYGR
ncbi:MAG TPA: hypothetical protein VHY32_03435 [Caulobacteraceae bacterium]|jgi:hypothetical protein|nr:hypothetical protein [Caulobacteraceae bacterium]